MDPLRSSTATDLCQTKEKEGVICAGTALGISLLKILFYKEKRLHQTKSTETPPKRPARAKVSKTRGRRGIEEAISQKNLPKFQRSEDDPDESHGEHDGL